ncbi:MAG: hypothetical protein H0V25_08665 [Solirubrobacterales bacterium]|nr:hypothetical protein [Solirubrobacterales bacterium]
MSEPTPPAGAPPSPPTRSPHTRRALALRILAALLIAGAALAVDRLWLRDEPSRSTFGATVRTKEIDSVLLDRSMPVKVVVPKGAPSSGRSLVVFLHGRGEDETSYLNEPMFEALSELRTRAPVIAFPDGGDSSFWHDREGGEWAGYVLTELLPQLIDRYDIDPARVAIGGISMGGFGAYDIARLDPGRFCAVAGHSPTIWESSGDTADGAFDDSDDFDRNNIIAVAGSDPNPYAGLHLWLDAGDDDPFLDGDAAFEDALRTAGSPPVVKHSSGGHDLGYWNGNWDEYLPWYAHVLRVCGDEARAAKKEDRGDGSKAIPKGEAGAGPASGSSPLSKPAAPRGAHSSG